jgi:hypothetical protein
MAEKFSTENAKPIDIEDEEIDRILSTPLKPVSANFSNPDYITSDSGFLKFSQLKEMGGTPMKNGRTYRIARGDARYWEGLEHGENMRQVKFKGNGHDFMIRHRNPNNANTPCCEIKAINIDRWLDGQSMGGLSALLATLSTLNQCLALHGISKTRL